MTVILCFLYKKGRLPETALEHELGGGGNTFRSYKLSAFSLSQRGLGGCSVVAKCRETILAASPVLGVYPQRVPVFVLHLEAWPSLLAAGWPSKRAGTSKSKSCATVHEPTRWRLRRAPQDPHEKACLQTLPVCEVLGGLVPWRFGPLSRVELSLQGFGQTM